MRSCWRTGDWGMAACCGMPLSCAPCKPSAPGDLSGPGADEGADDQTGQLCNRRLTASPDFGAAAVAERPWTRAESALNTPHERRAMARKLRFLCARVRGDEPAAPVNHTRTCAMPTSHRSPAAASASHRRKTSPSCRGGASSLLRLTPAVTRSQGLRAGGLGGLWARAAGMLSPLARHAVAVRPGEFAPSQWLVGADLPHRHPTRKQRAMQPRDMPAHSRLTLPQATCAHWHRSTVPRRRRHRCRPTVVSRC